MGTTAARARHFCPSTLLHMGILGGILGIAGCTAPWIRVEDQHDVGAILDATNSAVLVGELAGPWGLKMQKVEGIGLVVGLKGTGSDPAPSAQRAMLMNDMLARQVERPNQLLASPDTSLVLVQAYLPPGVQKGDPIDVEVLVPRRSQTTSLHGGWLMLTRLQEMAVLNNQVRTGHVRASVEGDVLTHALVEGTSDPVAKTMGRVLGGAISKMDRPIALVVRTEHQSVKTSSQIGAVINDRFHTYSQGIKVGVATPKRDSFIELRVHPRYRTNLARYVRVILDIPVRERAQERADRLDALKAQIHVAALAADAALKLEALGDEAKPILLEALKSDQPMVRFYSAEALAYLDHPAAAPILGDVANATPSLRRAALTALGIMEDQAGYEQLIGLLHHNSAETRYGAFRELRRINPHDPLLKGESLHDRFMLHRIASDAESMVHVARTRHPEIVLFGTDHPVRPPVMLTLECGIVVRDLPDGQLSVVQFSSKKSDQQLTCAPQLGALIRTVTEAGASYADVVQLIQEAKSSGCIESRVEFDAIPKYGRTLTLHEANQESQVANEADGLEGSGIEAKGTKAASPDGREAATDDTESIEEVDEAEAEAALFDDESPNDDEVEAESPPPSRSREADPDLADPAPLF